MCVSIYLGVYFLVQTRGGQIATLDSGIKLKCH